MLRKNIELWLALIANAVITILYLGYLAVSEVPAASSLVGHSLGVVGFVLMLMTEVLYSMRKRYKLARWGKMKNWLSFHIFTGLVGPYMVLLHSSWKFNGLAGILMLMTVIIVISGFIGRYFYTAVPRSLDGAEIGIDELEEQIIQYQQQLDGWRETQPELVGQVEDIFADKSKLPLFSLPLRRNRMKELESDQSGENLSMLNSMRQVWERQINLKRQLERLDAARRLLAVWHTVHIPIGVALFTVAFVHIGATLYYATLLR